MRWLERMQRKVSFLDDENQKQVYLLLCCLIFSEQLSNQWGLQLSLPYNCSTK